MVYTGTLACAPPAIFHSGSPARLHRKSQSAVSIAASARLVIAPTAVACVAKKRSFQIASICAASRPMSRGARWSRSSATTDEPPVPIVYVYPTPTAPSSQVIRTSGVSCVTKDWIASLRATGGGRLTCRISTRSIDVMAGA